MPPESTPAQPRKAAAPKSTPPLKVSSTFLERVNTVTGGSATLVTTFGEIGRSEFLVPFVDVSLIDPQDSEAPEIFGLLMPLESAVFTVALLSNELADALDRYATLVSDKVRPEPTRFQAIIDYVAKAQEGLLQLDATARRITATDA